MSAVQGVARLHSLRVSVHNHVRNLPTPVLLATMIVTVCVCVCVCMLQLHSITIASDFVVEFQLIDDSQHALA